MKMKKNILILLLFSMISATMFAQGANNEKIQALKTAFITNKLDLSSKEAQLFWPVYNEYSKTIQRVKVQKSRQIAVQLKNKGGVNNLSDKEATSLIQEHLLIDTKVLEAKKKLYEKLSEILPPKKLIRLFKAEQDFNKELLKQLRERRMQMINRRN